MEARIDYSEIKYKKVAANSIEGTGGVVIPDGEKVGISRAILNGVKDGYVSLVWDHAGEDEKVLLSTDTSIDIIFDLTDEEIHITGDGVKKLILCLDNRDSVESPSIGGHYTLTKL